MHAIQCVLAGALIGAAAVVTPAVVLAAPAFASSKDNVMAVAAEHDAHQNLEHANHAADVGMAHAQRDVLRVTRTGGMLFHDDGGHQQSFGGHAVAKGS
jgi:hypothetical protein